MAIGLFLALANQVRRMILIIDLISDDLQKNASQVHVVLPRMFYTARSVKEKVLLGHKGH